MSTPLKSIKNVICFSKTVVSRAFDEMEKGGIYKKFLFDSGVVNLGRKQEITADEIERDLAFAIVSQNINDFNTQYENRYLEDAKNHRMVAEKEIELMPILSSHVLPKNHLSNAVLSAMTSDIIHGIDENNDLRNALGEFRKDIFMESMVSHPAYEKAEIDTIQKAALSFLSMKASGDTMLERNRALAMTIERVRSEGEYPNTGYGREYYPDNVIAGYLNCFYNNDYSSILFDGKVHDGNLPDIANQTGMSFRIMSDIPSPSEKDMFAVAKILSKLSDFVSTDEWAQKAKAENSTLSDDNIEKIRYDLLEIKNDYAMMVTGNMSMFKKTMNNQYHHESEPTM